MAKVDKPTESSMQPKLDEGLTQQAHLSEVADEVTDGSLVVQGSAHESRGEEGGEGQEEIQITPPAAKSQPSEATPKYEGLRVSEENFRALLAQAEEIVNRAKLGASHAHQHGSWSKPFNLETTVKPRKAIGENADISGQVESDVVEETISQKPNRDAKYVAELVGREKDKDLCGALKKEILDILAENPGIVQYEVVFLYDHSQISRYHASAIYQKLAAIKNKKDIFLILRSPGGEVEPAYLISKMCNRYKLAKFVVGIPADAKSAATLLSLGADELHMGAMSELGPIDPQINDFPALAFSGALERITKLADEYPGAAKMLSQYLIGSSLDVRALGYYERITESAAQYASRLLKSKLTSTDVNIEAVSALAAHFTNHYKDHNFVIDIDEACELFAPLGGDVVKADTELYKTCHEVHRFIDLFHQVCAVKNLDKRLVVIGDSFVLRSTAK
ncbi:serine dehydrogenase proteinase [Pseudomonas sp. WPR_5_2]|nr:serine dehydrogenase proteinase [Pseudomonas sp. WPR_5_2]